MAPDILHTNVSTLRQTFAGLAAFAIIYNITFRFNEALTSGRFAVIALVVWLFFNKNTYRTEFDWRILAPFAPVPYVLLQWILIGDSGQTSRFFHLAFYSYLGGIILSLYISDLRTMLRVLLAVISLQAMILFFSFVSIDYRNWLDSRIVTGGNFGALNLYRAPGLTSNAGSALSVIQSFGVLCGGWLLMLRTSSTRPWAMWGVTGLMLLCLASCAIVGRTGLYLSFVFLLISVHYSKSYRFLAVWIICLLLLLLYFGISALENLLPSKVSFEWLTNWMLGIFSDDDQTFSTLNSMPVPSISDIDSWLGHGLVNLVEGANPSGHDSGFIQSYYSMGLFFTIILYAAYFYALIRLLGWLPPKFSWLLSIILFAIEIKEPFLFKYATMFIVIAVYSAAIRDSFQSNSHIKT